jgi:hypothetical protein
MKENKKLNQNQAEKEDDIVSSKNKKTTANPEENKTEYGKQGRPTKYKWDGPEG